MAEAAQDGWFAGQTGPSESAEDGEVVPFARTHPTTRTARGKEDAS